MAKNCLKYGKNTYKPDVLFDKVRQNPELFTKKHGIVGYDIERLLDNADTDSNSNEVDLSIADNKKTGFNEGVVSVKKNAEEYKSLNGIKKIDHAPVYKLFPSVSRAIANEYPLMKHDPNNPIVKASYEAMVQEAAKQYDFIVSKGINIEPHTGEGEPYKNSKEMLADVKDNNRLKFKPNDSAFGSEGDRERFSSTSRKQNS